MYENNDIIFVFHLDDGIIKNMIVFVHAKATIICVFWPRVYIVYSR